MSVTQMLLAFSDSKSEKMSKPRAEKGRRTTGKHKRSTDAAHAEVTKKATDRYRKAMLGKGWMTTGKVEQAMGHSTGTASDFLRKLLKELKLIEQRPKDGRPYNRRSGWEWRWIQQEKHNAP